MEVDRGQCVRIYAPEWFERGDFREFLRKQTGHPVRPLATWHQAGAEPHDMSDVFMTLQGSDLSEADLLPPDITESILAIARASEVDLGVVWLSNANREFEHESSRQAH